MSTINKYLLLVPLLVGSLSCMTTRHLPESSELPQSAPSAPVVLMAGDEIDVRFRYWPEFDDVQIIRPDGKISLQLVQGVDAAGLTPEELQTRLIELYQDKIRDPDIVVIVRQMVNQKIFVGGEVLQPGLFEMRGHMTALQAVMMAGGFRNLSAQKRDVVIVRQIGDQLYAGAVDMRAELTGKSTNPVYLQQNAIVFVPRTGIDQINQWVDQYLEEIVPLRILSALEIIDEITEDDDNEDDRFNSLPLDFTQNPFSSGTGGGGNAGGLGGLGLPVINP